MAGVLPPLGDRPRGSPVWCDSLLVGLNRPLLDNKGLSPLTSRRARLARGCSWDMPVGWVLPPLGDRPRGSPVWQGVTPCTPEPRQKARGCSWDMRVSWVLPPLGNRPRGSRVWQGVTPCTPNRAKRRGAARGTCGLAGFYRRSATGLAARGSGAAPCRWPIRTAIRRQDP